MKDQPLVVSAGMAEPMTSTAALSGAAPTAQAAQPVTTTETKPAQQKERHSAAPIDPRLLRRAGATRTYMISSVVVGCLMAVLVILQAKLLSSAIAAVFSNHTLGNITLSLILLGLVLLGRGVLTWASAWLAQRTSAAVKSQLRRDILAARLGTPAHQTSSSSSLVTLVTSGLDALDGYFSKYLPQLLLALTVPIIVGAAILFSDWRSALIIAATIPFIPILMALVGWTTEKQVSRRWAYQSRLASHFADLVAGLPTLQVFGRAKAQAEGLKRTENANRRETMAILRISFLSAFVLELFSTLAVAVIALVIGSRLVYGHMPFATALFVLILAPEVYLPIRQVGVHYHDSADGLAAAEAAFAEIDRGGTGEATDESTSDKAMRRFKRQRARAESESLAEQTEPGSPRGLTAEPGFSGPVDGSGTSSPDHSENPLATSTPLPRSYPVSIEVRNLSYTYPGTDTPIGPFSLEVRPGEIVALAGRSGGGKTTLLNCILGFLIPSQAEPDSTPERDKKEPSPLSHTGRDTGERDTGDGSFLSHSTLTLGGVDAGVLDWALWRSAIAYVPQIPGMIDGSIADNVRLGCPEASDEQVRQVLAAAGAANLEPARSVGEEGEGLSVGERRRVGIARALARIEISGARLLILDEPTAGLDADTEATVLRGLKQSGATALVVSHRAAVLDAADRVIAIGDPVAAANGSAATPRQSADDKRFLPWSTPVPQVVQSSAADSSPAPAGGVTADRGLVREDDTTTLGGVWASQGRVPTKPTNTETTNPSATPEQPAGGKTTSPLLRLVFQLLDSVPGARSRLLLAIVFAAFASAAAVALMGVSAWLISKAAEHPPFLELSVAAVGVRFFGISRGVFRYVERLVGHDVALSMQSALRLKTYQALARTTLLGRRQGDLLVRVVADVGAIEDIVVRIVQPFLAASLVVVVVCAMLGRFSLAVALTVFISAILGGLIVPWLTQRFSLKADEQAVPLRGELGVVVHNLSRNAIDLAAYGAVGRGLARMAGVDLALRKTEEASAWAKGIGAGLQTVIAGLGFSGGLWLAAIAVTNASMGERLLAVMVLTPMALHEVFATFTQAAQTWTRAKVALTRVSAILDTPAIGQGDVEPRPLGETPGLRCRGLTIGWPGHAPVASGIDLDIFPGQAVAVMGPSGVGKTTLAATVMGLIPPLAGELSSSGRIGYLAQDAHIFTTTIAENVRIGNKNASDDEVVEALREAGLELPPEREVGEMGAGLSGGEVRRLALARLFVGDYRLLILDEPTEHLDRETADALMDEIFAGAAQSPVLVISHDESVAARCAQVIHMG